LKPLLLPTDAPSHATELARAAIAEGADLVLVLGGDGTINEVVNGMAHSRVPLGVLPGGTANVLAMEIGLGSRLDRAVELLKTSVERRVALGRLCYTGIEPRYFLSMAGVGLDASIVNRVSASLKARAGKLAYWLAGLTHFGQSIGQFEACVNGDPRRCGFALVSRVRNYGGDLEIASGASLLNDDFEVVLFEGSNPLRYAGYMLAVGARRAQSMPGVHTFRAARVEFSGDAHVQIDGEYAGRAPAALEIVPDAVTLLMPETYR
jgi:diacylglycerol kinase (ATP)